eukprot:875065_1
MITNTSQMPVHHNGAFAMHAMEHLEAKNTQAIDKFELAQNGWDNHDQKDSDVNNHAKGFIAKIPKKIKNQQHKQHCFLKNATGTICDDQDHEKWIPHAQKRQK